MPENITPVQLQVSGFENREVLFVDYKFDQTTDLEGQISGIPRGGQVTIRVKAMNNGNNQLLQWMLAEHDPRNMTIKFYKTTDGSAMKELNGEGCYCVHYIEKWEEGQQHYEEIVVVCQKLTNGPVSYQNPWK